MALPLRLNKRGAAGIRAPFSIPSYKISNEFTPGTWVNFYLVEIEHCKCFTVGGKLKKDERVFFLSVDPFKVIPEKPTR